MKFQSIGFMFCPGNWGCDYCDVELCNCVIECSGPSGHILELDSILVFFDKLTTITCPICGKKGQVSLTIAKEMKFKSIGFLFCAGGKGFYNCDVEFSDSLIMCSGHTFRISAHTAENPELNPILIYFNKPTTITCPICKQEGEVSLMIETKDNEYQNKLETDDNDQKQNQTM